MLVSSEAERAAGHGLAESEYRALYELRDQSRDEALFRRDARVVEPPPHGGLHDRRILTGDVGAQLRDHAVQPLLFGGLVLIEGRLVLGLLALARSSAAASSGSAASTASASERSLVSPSATSALSQPVAGAASITPSGRSSFRPRPGSPVRSPSVCSSCAMSCPFRDDVVARRAFSVRADTAVGQGLDGRSGRG